MWIVALSPIVGMIATVAIYAVIAHASGKTLLALATGVAGGIILLALMLAMGFRVAPPTQDDAIGWSITAVAAFLALAFCFWATINLIATSLRIRVLRELYAAPQRQLAPEALENLYSASDAVETRLKRLEDIGVLRIADTRVFLAKRTLLTIGAAVALARRIIIPTIRSK